MSRSDKSGSPGVVWTMPEYNYGSERGSKPKL